MKSLLILLFFGLTAQAGVNVNSELVKSELNKDFFKWFGTQAAHSTLRFEQKEVWFLDGASSIADFKTFDHASLSFLFKPVVLKPNDNVKPVPGFEKDFYLAIHLGLNGFKTIGLVSFDRNEKHLEWDLETATRREVNFTQSPAVPLFYDLDTVMIMVKEGSSISEINAWVTKINQKFPDLNAYIKSYGDETAWIALEPKNRVDVDYGAQGNEAVLKEPTDESYYVSILKVLSETDGLSFVESIEFNGLFYRVPYQFGMPMHLMGAKGNFDTDDLRTLTKKLMDDGIPFRTQSSLPKPLGMGVIWK